jgi:hypothetical protein
VADKFVQAESARSAGEIRTEMWVEDMEMVRLVEVEAVGISAIWLILSLNSVFNIEGA